MNFSNETQEKIKVVLKNNPSMMEKLLSFDADAIRELGSLSQRGINPKDVTAAFESNDSETLNYLYKQAKRLIELQELYKELCLEFCKIKNEAKKTMSDDKMGKVI